MAIECTLNIFITLRFASSYLLGIYFLAVHHLRQKTKKTWAFCIRVNSNVLDSKRQYILTLVNLSLITIYVVVFQFPSYIHTVYIQNVIGSKVSCKDSSAALGKQAKWALKRPDHPLPPCFLQSGVNPPVQGTLPSPSKLLRHQVKTNLLQSLELQMDL